MANGVVCPNCKTPLEGNFKRGDILECSVCQRKFNVTLPDLNNFKKLQPHAVLIEPSKEKKKNSIWGYLIILLIGVFALGRCAKPNDTATSAEPLSMQTGNRAESNDTKLTNSPNANQNSNSADAKDTLTASQKNAIRSAESYLNMQGFSHDGLIHQLSSSAGEGYSLEDATVAVNSLNVDWNEQATKSAKAYLSMQGFSCDNLIHQLSSDAGEKYTQSEAEYGAKQAGACN